MVLVFCENTLVKILRFAEKIFVFAGLNDQKYYKNESLLFDAVHLLNIPHSERLVLTGSKQVGLLRVKAQLPYTVKVSSQ